MRAYFFGNFYLSSIQQGIQAQHCTAEMFVKYYPPTEEWQQGDVLHDWAKNHKTSILLNGGDCEQLKLLAMILSREPGSPYPWAVFHESELALNHAITCVGIILPEKMYSDETKQYVRSESRRQQGTVIAYDFPTPDLTPWEFDLVARMSNCRMAH